MPVCLASNSLAAMPGNRFFSKASTRIRVWDGEMGVRFLRDCFWKLSGEEGRKKRGVVRQLHIRGGARYLWWDCLSGEGASLALHALSSHWILRGGSSSNACVPLWKGPKPMEEGDSALTVLGPEGAMPSWPGNGPPAKRWHSVCSRDKH